MRSLWEGERGEGLKQTRQDLDAFQTDFLKMLDIHTVPVVAKQLGDVLSVEYTVFFLIESVFGHQSFQK